MPTPDSENPLETSPAQRIGLREIARALDVSLMTVSLALRNSPKISEATRVRVQQMAEKLGYRPDPEISRLMTRLHTSAQSSDRTPMAIVDLSSDRLPPGTENYCEHVRRGAVKRAESLGYIASCFHVLDYDGDIKRMLRVIRYRGIRGILLLPPLAPIELPSGLDWSAFSVISATYAISGTEFHRVVPHQFIDMCRLIGILEERGYKRIGAVLGRGFEKRIHYHFTAALALHRYDSLIFRVVESAPFEKKEFSAWLTEHRPDALIASNLVDVIAALPKTRGYTPPRVVSFRATSNPHITYWDERPQEIGAVAAVLLAGMVQHNEYGVPASPRTTMIHGVLHDPDSVAASRKKNRRSKDISA